MKDYHGFGDFQQNQVIGDFLLREGVVSADELNRAIEHQTIINARLDTAILDLGLVREHQMLEGLGRLYRSPTVSGIELEFIQPSISRVIAPRMAARYKIVPFKIDGKRISIASMKRTDVLLEDELRMLTGCVITTYVTLEVYLTEALASHYGVERTLVMRMLSQRLRSTERIEQKQPRVAPEPRAENPRAEKPRATPVPVLRLEPEPPLPEPSPEINAIELSDDDYDLLSLSRGIDNGPAEASQLEDLPRVPETRPEPAVEALYPDSPNIMLPIPREILSPEERLADAADQLKNAEMREDIGDVILEFCELYFRRRMLLVRRGETIMGWRGDGEGVDELAVRAISIPVSEPSVFVGLGETVKFWLGPLPPLTRNIDLVFGLGSAQPKECIILPVLVRSKVIAYFYGDNLDQSIASAPMNELRRLIVKVGIAFQVYILKNKIHIA